MTALLQDRLCSWLCDNMQIWWRELHDCGNEGMTVSLRDH
uniref:Uncharacterized protein n=1 Tax=Anguilla anguilla TaxID=7936 RepID=A0A0E9TEF4_ANGAN